MDYRRRRSGKALLLALSLCERTGARRNKNANRHEAEAKGRLISERSRWRPGCSRGQAPERLASPHAGAQRQNLVVLAGQRRKGAAHPAGTATYRRTTVCAKRQAHDVLLDDQPGSRTPVAGAQMLPRLGLGSGFGRLAEKLMVARIWKWWAHKESNLEPTD